MVQQNPQNSNTNDNLEARRKEREEYYLRKAELQKLEKRNSGRLNFMRGTGGFWILAGKSAAIMANKLARELKMRVPLKNDTDFEYRFKEGKVSIKSIDYYKNKLLDSGLATIESETEDFLIFKLKKAIGKEELELIIEDKELRRKRLEEDSLKVIPLPKTHQQITETTRIAFKIYSKYTNAQAKECFGKPMINEFRAANKVFILICMNEIELSTGIRKVKEYLNMAQASVVQMLELGIWSVEDAASAINSIIQTRLTLEREEKEAIKIKERYDALSKRRND